MPTTSNGGDQCRCKKFQYPTVPPSLSQGREAEVKELLRSFASPTNSLAVMTLLSVVEEDLTKCQSALLAFEREKMRLDGIILSLQNQKARLKAFAEASASLKAPIRRLPKEIMENIFFQLDPRCVIGPAGTRIDGFRLAGVCSSWRGVALSSRSLWCNIILKMDGIPQNAAVWQVDFVQDILRRSGQLPLSLDLSGSRHPALLDTLAAHAHRWSTVRMQYGYFHDLNLPLTRLQSLAIPFALLSAFERSSSSIKMLEQLHFYDSSILVASLVPTPSFLGLLRHLSLRIKIRAQTLLDIIKACGNLQSLSLSHCRGSSRDNPDNLAPFASPIRTLELRSCNQDITKALLSSVTLSHLESLTLDVTYSRPGTVVQQPGPPPLPIAELSAMVARSNPSVKTLTIQHVLLDPAELVSALALFPTVESFTHRNPAQGAIDQDFKYKMLFKSLNPNIKTMSTGLVLPKLAQLSLAIAETEVFPAKEFVKMLASRWTPEVASDSIACLKSVKFAAPPAALFDKEDSLTLDILRAAGLVVELVEE